jgi:uncharacterized RmlC-like cupin family protein
MSTEAESAGIPTHVKRVKPEDRTPAAAQTAGMIREEAIQTEQLWAGIARTAPGSTSGWHHHGAWDTVAYVIAGAVRLECGTGGRAIVQAEAGDHLFIPKAEVHRESNPTDGEQVLSIVRIGRGPVVINVEGPALE